MPKKTEFHAVDFFRAVRDKQAATLSGKPPAEIIAFFKPAKKKYSPKHVKAASRVASRRSK